MDTFQHLLAGLTAATSLQKLGFALIGCFLGTLIGVLPGLGPAAGTAILIPLTFTLDPIGALIMLSAIYYGAMYGGRRAAIFGHVTMSDLSLQSDPKRALLGRCRLSRFYEYLAAADAISCLLLKTAAERAGDRD